MNIVKRTLAGVSVAATLLTVAAPAHAQRYHHRDRGSNAGVAIAAGVVGLAVGAALASDRRGYHGGYDRRYYEGPRYSYRHNGYRDDGYRHNGYRHNGYYRDGNRGGYGYHERRCVVERFYDEYDGRWVRVRRCR